MKFKLRGYPQDKTQAISPSLSCKLTEIISLADISDVYSVATGHDPFEFIIRKTRQTATLYFSSPRREQIVKVCSVAGLAISFFHICFPQSVRAAKGRMRTSAFPGTERFSRLSNVSAALLHIGMMNMGVDDDELRGASYELLSSVLASFNLDSNPLITLRGSYFSDRQSLY